MVEIHFDSGSLVVPVLEGDARAVEEILTYDARTKVYRAPAHRYRDLIRRLHRAGVAYRDQARGFCALDLRAKEAIAPYPHQEEALARWVRAGSRGIVELPTGAGKTILAVMAILHVRRSTLVVVPTIDLMVQWQEVLERHLGEQVGMLGGGESDRREITVTTYDSAAFQTEFHGGRFGLLVCDECHHLPAPAYRFIAEGSIAPFRLGLTATLERADGGERLAMELLGPLVHRSSIEALEGRFLAPYDVRSVPVALTDEESDRYHEARRTYLDFVRRAGISFDQPSGFGRFLARSQASAEGRVAFQCYREQRRIALTSAAKIEALWRVLLEHREDRVLVFTEDNETVYLLSRRFLIPTITHHTRPKERRYLLNAFTGGELRVLLTSRVLNEGVDVPEASVGVVLSGSGSVREHVQRLGRILRKRPGKRAVLYEIFTDVAAELNISERRRQHSAYRRAEGRADGRSEDPC